jgi:hypothetical protein
LQRKAPDRIFRSRHSRTRDHPSKTRDRDGNLIDNGPTGSVFKTNGAGSVARINSDGNGILTLVHQKANFSARADSTRTKMVFEDDGRALKFVNLSSQETEGTLVNVSGKERVLEYLRNKAGSTGVEAQQMAHDLDMKVATVQSYLSRWKEKGKADHLPNKLWVAVPLS